MSESIEARALKWALSGDTGTSSEALCAHMSGINVRYPSHPSDPSDFGRCLRLLEKMPEWEPRINEMAEHGPGWAGLSNSWQEIKNLYHEERQAGRSAPKTYHAMKLAIAEGYRKDERYECCFNPDGHVSWCEYVGDRKDAQTKAT